MRLREKAVPFALLGCGCAAYITLLVLTESRERTEPAAVEIPAVASAVVLGVAALGALAWVIAGILLLRKGLGPAKGAETRAGLFEVAGAAGVFLIAIAAIAALSAILGLGHSMPVRMAAVAAAQCAAVGYAWARLRAFPASFGRPWLGFLTGATAYLLIFPFLFVSGELSARAMKLLSWKVRMHPAMQELLAEVSVPETVGIFVLGVAVAPFVEEVLFRGIVYGALRRRLAPMTAAILSGAVFAAIHVQPAQFLPLFVLGVALALVYEQTGSLAASVGLHAANNAVAFGALLAARFCSSGGG